MESSFYRTFITIFHLSTLFYHFLPFSYHVYHTLSPSSLTLLSYFHQNRTQIHPNGTRAHGNVAQRSQRNVLSLYFFYFLYIFSNLSCVFDIFLTYYAINFICTYSYVDYHAFFSHLIGILSFDFHRFPNILLTTIYVLLPNILLITICITS